MVALPVSTRLPDLRLVLLEGQELSAAPFEWLGSHSWSFTLILIISRSSASPSDLHSHHFTHTTLFDLQTSITCHTRISVVFTRRPLRFAAIPTRPSTFAFHYRCLASFFHKALLSQSYPNQLSNQNVCQQQHVSRGIPQRRSVAKQTTPVRAYPHAHRCDKRWHLGQL